MSCKLSGIISWIKSMDLSFKCCDRSDSQVWICLGHNKILSYLFWSGFSCKKRMTMTVWRNGGRWKQIVYFDKFEALYKFSMHIKRFHNYMGWFSANAYNLSRWYLYIRRTSESWNYSLFAIREVIIGGLLSYQDEKDTWAGFIDLSNR